MALTRSRLTIKVKQTTMWKCSKSRFRLIKSFLHQSLSNLLILESSPSTHKYLPKKSHPISTLLSEELLTQCSMMVKLTFSCSNPSEIKIFLSSSRFKTKILTMVSWNYFSQFPVWKNKEPKLLQQLYLTFPIPSIQNKEL